MMLELPPPPPPPPKKKNNKKKQWHLAKWNADMGLNSLIFDVSLLLGLDNGHTTQPAARNAM